MTEIEGLVVLKGTHIMPLVALTTVIMNNTIILFSILSCFILPQTHIHKNILFGCPYNISVVSLHTQGIILTILDDMLYRDQ